MANITEENILRLKKLYLTKQEDIRSRIADFETCHLKEKTDESVFSELAFCLLTPQSKAKACWQAIEKLRSDGTLFQGSSDQIKKRLHCVRFHNKKAEYIVQARYVFFQNGNSLIQSIHDSFQKPAESRDWLVRNIKGLGYKEASHFLRNIGRGESLAILDRHVLRNLLRLGTIASIPSSLSRSRYLHVEKEMTAFAEKIDIPLSHLDLLLWYRETGEIFK